MRLAAFVLAVSAVFFQSPDQRVTLEGPGGAVTGMLRVPESAKRPPVVCLLSPTGAADLAIALASEGVASLMLDPAKTDPDTAAHWIALLRNDERFPTVTMFGDGAQVSTAVIAARAARADGVITRGDITATAGELARVIAKVGTVTPKSAADDGKRIADFAKSVTALGRRGTSATRPATARRSPRQVMMAIVGSTRVSIEWGAPQKRGREIWGELVKWDEEWTPGSDESPTITTDGPITIGGIQVPTGDHTFFALPSANKFELIISKDVGQFHTQHDASKHLGRVEMTLTTLPDSVEGLTYAIEGGMLKLKWDKREYSTTIK